MEQFDDFISVERIIMSQEVLSIRDTVLETTETLHQLLAELVSDVDKSEKTDFLIR